MDEREVRHVGGLCTERLRLRHARDARAEREVEADERGDAARAAEEHEDERARHAEERERPKQPKNGRDQSSQRTSMATKTPGASGRPQNKRTGGKKTGKGKEERAS
jgi:hypothetical protein